MSFSQSLNIGLLLYIEVDAAYWIIDDLPKNYGLFEQVTHPKEKKEVTTGKQRLDRFVFGEYAVFERASGLILI